MSTPIQSAALERLPPVPIPRTLLLDLSLSYNPLLLVAALGAAGGLAWWTYGRTTPAVSGPRRGVLAALRFVALFVVILLLFEPVFRNVSASEDPPVLAVLVDASESVVAGGEDGRVVEALSGLDAEDVVIYTFDGDVRREARFEPESLRFEGERTDITRGLQHIARELAGRNLRGVLLISDGRYNTGSNPVYLAERYRTPIYTAVVGDTTTQRDVRVTRVVTNEVAYAGAELPVRIGVAASGYAGERVTVTLSDGDRVVDSRVIELPDDGIERTVDLTVRPTTPGLHRLAGSVSRSPGEATLRNNSETVTVRVLDTRRRVLLLGAAPGPDLTAVRNALEANTNMELTTRVQRSAGSFYEGALPDDLSAFDVVVLSGYPGRAADAATAARVADAIREGLPALFILSGQTSLGLLSEAFGEVLPARPEVVRPGFSEAGIEVSPAGSTHPVLDVPEVDGSALGGLPPLLVNESRWALAPDARVLATQRRGGASINAPLLVVGGSGEHRTAALLGAGSWRWANLSADLEAVSGFFPGLVENLMQWVTSRADRRQVRVRPSHAQFGEQERVTFSGQVYDESLNPMSDADLRLTIVAPGGVETPFTMRPLGNGRYSLDAGILAPGTYAFHAQAEGPSGTVGTDAGDFSVGSLALEFREPGANAALMRQIALRSGGREVAMDQVPSLKDQLAAEGRFVPDVVEQERETPLLHLTILLALAIAALTLEWFLRKRSGMV